METPRELYKSTTPRKLLNLILDSDISLKFGQDRVATAKEKVIVKGKMTVLIDNNQCSVLLRGITKSTTKERLISKLNSNDSLYDGLFLVGDKAKNFLEKSESIPHPVKTISSIGHETASWIFDTYSNLTQGPIAYRNGIYGVNIDNTSISISRTINAMTFNQDRIMFLTSVWKIEAVLIERDNPKIYEDKDPAKYQTAGYRFENFFSGRSIEIHYDGVDKFINKYCR